MWTVVGKSLKTKSLWFAFSMKALLKSLYTLYINIPYFYVEKQPQLQMFYFSMLQTFTKMFIIIVNKVNAIYILGYVTIVGSSVHLSL